MCIHYCEREEVYNIENYLLASSLYLTIAYVDLFIDDTKSNSLESMFYIIHDFVNVLNN